VSYQRGFRLEKNVF